MPKADNLAAVSATLRQARATQGALSVLAILSTVLWFALWQLHSLGPTPAHDFLALGFCIASGWLAARFIALFRTRLPIETSPAYQLLQNEPENVLWMFPEPVHLRIGPWRREIERNIVLLTKDGRAYKLHGVTRANYPALESALRRIAPQARFGWSEKNRRFYQQRTGLFVK